MFDKEGSLKMEKYCDCLILNSAEFKEKIQTLNIKNFKNNVEKLWLSTKDITEDIKDRFSQKDSSTEKLSFYEKASMINHSCDPNCFKLCIDETIVVFSTKNIEKGA